jgi:transcriptional regulator with XRE-family HTH domain
MTNNVREIRRRALLSAAELAELIGVSASAITAIERGKRAGWKTRRRLALALNATDVELFPTDEATS